MDEPKFPKLTIHNLGPIKDCEMVVHDFTVFVGPQSQGKSTIAKAVYFFRSVKQDIIDLMLRGWPFFVQKIESSSWADALGERLEDKFHSLFDRSFYWAGTSLRYDYTEDVWISFSISASNTHSVLDMVSLPTLSFTFGESLSAYLASLDEKTAQSSRQLSPEDKETVESDLNRLFQDDNALVYIPAGRQLTTLLNSQLNYVFASMDDVQRFFVDYLIFDYVKRILRLKPLFENGWDGLTVNLKRMMTKEIRKTLDFLKARSQKILGGEYRCPNGIERLFINESSPVALNHTSSGQQEAVWPLNLIFYYSLIEKHKTFLIFEEPESNLYPDAQRTMGELLALFRNTGNQVMVTTHSPYLLGTFNYLLMGSQCESAGLADGLRKTLETQYQLTPDFWLSPANTDAYFVSGGSMEDAKTDIDGVRMIKNELIDAVSEEINAVSDLFLEQLYGWDNGDT